MPDAAPLGVILAGGRSSRMGGGDKALRALRGRPILSHVVDRFAPQVPALALNANGDGSRFAAWGLPVLPDPVPGRPGPLAGILAAMIWAATAGADHVVTVPADLPFLPGDLVPRLILAAETTGRSVAIAATASDGRPRRHPACGYWPVSLAADLADALGGNMRRAHDWADRHGAAHAIFAADRGDPFFNVNTPDDLARLEAMS